MYNFNHIYKRFGFDRNRRVTFAEIIQLAEASSYVQQMRAGVYTILHQVGKNIK